MSTFTDFIVDPLLGDAGSGAGEVTIIHTDEA